ncbi:MAG: Cys-Gln thioester bond-forming surface protein [Erysipelotrichaceae bacterium]|nr:Cys-Gln thioester bond-forming surface protein [Erysipelotrichaceae bacterium]
MNRLIKIISILAFFITSFFTLPETNAEEVSSTDTNIQDFQIIEEESVTDWDTFLAISNAFPDEMFEGIELFSLLEKSHRVAKFYCDNEYGYGFITFLILDGEPVFCLEPTAVIHWDKDYYETTAWWDLSWDQQQKIWQYAYYGYAYPGHQNDRYYLASQLMIWSVVDRWYDPYTTDGGSYYDVGPEIDEIHRLISSAGSTPSFHNQTIDLAMDLPVSITDSRNSLHNYGISSLKGIDVSTSGNQMTFTLTSEEYAKSASFSPKTSGGFGTPIVYKSNGSQTVMKVRPYDPLKPFTLNFKWGKGNGQLIKIDEDGHAVKDVQFSIASDKNFENTIGSYTTDESGTFTISDLPARKYYVKEISAPEQYVVDDTVKTIDVLPNKTAKLEVEDEFVKGKVKLIKTDAEIGTPLAGAIYGLFNEQNQKLQELVVQANGEATSDYIRFGRYYVKEEIAPHGYLADTETKHWFEIKTHDSIVEIEAEDLIQRGKIIIDKVDKELYGGMKDSLITDYDLSGTQGDGLLKGATYGLYARNDIIHLDGKTGVITFNDNANDTYQITLTKGTELIVRDNPAKAGTLIATAKTDENGQIEFSHLLLGDYYIKEITPSEGYLLDTTEYDVSLKYAGQNAAIASNRITVFETIKRQAFEIYKAGHVANTSGNAVPLEGVHFEVKLENDIQKLISEGHSLEEAKKLAPLYDELITNLEGKDTSIELPYGRYRIFETITSPDYSLAEDFFVTITEDSRIPQDYSNNVIVNELFTAYLKLLKKDAETGMTVLLKDTTFKIKTLEDTIFNGKNFKAGEYLSYISWDVSSGMTVDTWKTDENGMVMIGEKLTAGDYEISEIQAPFGYILDETPFTVTIANDKISETAADGNPVIITVKEDISAKGIIEVHKTGEVLSGTKTDSNGQIDFEYSNSDLYGAEFKLFAEEDIYSADNQKNLIYEKGEFIETIAISEGFGSSSELPLGKYRIVETTAGDGFILNKTEKVVEISYDGEYVPIVYEEVSYINERQKVEVTVTKQDQATCAPLSGAVFGLYAAEDIYPHKNPNLAALGSTSTILVNKGELIETVTTDSSGKAVFHADLPLNTHFKIIELKAPKGYASTDFVYEFFTEYKGQDVPVIYFDALFENEITQIEISKKDITNNEEIAGAFLAVYEDDPSEFIDSWTSGDDGFNEDGTINPHIIKGLEVGKTYYLEEIISPYGFAISEEIEFTVKDTGGIQKVEMKDELTMGQLKWNKTGEVFNEVIETETEFGTALFPIWNEVNLKGAEISIYAEEDIIIGNTQYYEKDELIETLVSDTEPVLSKLLPVGNYYYLETKAPEGYICDTEKHNFQIEHTMSKDLQVVISTLENTRSSFDIDMVKILETQTIFPNPEAYKDIIFGIYANEDILDYNQDVKIPNNSLIAVSEITVDGHLELVPDLPNGAYFIKELATNNQYILDETEYEFEISYKGEHITHYTVKINDGSIDNELARGSIIVQKKDADDESIILSGVPFHLSISPDMNEILSTVETDGSGIAFFTDLELGTYYIQEAGQVEGYTLNDTIYQVNVTANGDELEIICNNIPTEIEFSKVDESNDKPLSGATLQVIDKETSEIIDEWISSEENHVIKYLVEGKEYVFIEIKAPNGYYTAESITFIAKDQDMIIMKDKRIPIITEVPNTKDDSSAMIWAFIAGLSGLLMLLTMIQKRKQTNQ